MTLALAECDACGARMPLREAFPIEQLLASAFTSPRLTPMEGPCTCGGWLREDMATTLAAMREAIEGDGE